MKIPNFPTYIPSVYNTTYISSSATCLDKCVKPYASCPGSILLKIDKFT